MKPLFFFFITIYYYYNINNFFKFGALFNFFQVFYKFNFLFQLFSVYFYSFIFNFKIFFFRFKCIIIFYHFSIIACFCYLFFFFFLQLLVFISAFFIAFVNGTCDPESNPCVFLSPIESIVGMFAMNVGEFEDIYGTFDYSEYPTFIKVSDAIGGTVIFDGIYFSLKWDMYMFIHQCLSA